MSAQNHCHILVLPQNLEIPPFPASPRSAAAGSIDVLADLFEVEPERRCNVIPLNFLPVSGLRYFEPLLDEGDEDGTENVRVLERERRVEVGDIVVAGVVGDRVALGRIGD